MGGLSWSSVVTGKTITQNHPVCFVVSYREAKIEVYLVGGWPGGCLGTFELIKQREVMTIICE